MAEYIDRDKLIKAIVNTPSPITRAVSAKYLSGMAQRELEIVTLIHDEPAADVWEKDTATICGYSAQELISFAGVMRENGISPTDLHELFGNIKSAVEVVHTLIDKQTKSFIADLVESAKDYECNVFYHGAHVKEKDDG